MKRYPIVVERTEAGFSAYSPDLPGCVSTGHTREEVEANMREAIEFHIEGLQLEGLPVPEPSSSPDVLAGDDSVQFTAAFRERAVAANYYLNTLAQANGNHEVHREGCSWMPAPHNRLSLGQFTDCDAAVREAKKYRTQVNGCYHCSYACHTG